jgi:hypothetical protein
VRASAHRYHNRWLVNPSNPYHETYSRDIKAAASGRGLQILDLNVRTERDLDTTLANLREQHADGLVVTDEPLFAGLRVQLLALAAPYNIPTIYPWREDAQAAGLISHGPAAQIRYAKSASTLAESQGRQAIRSASFAADQIRDCPKSQNGDGGPTRGSLTLFLRRQLFAEQSAARAIVGKTQLNERIEIEVAQVLRRQRSNV